MNFNEWMAKYGNANGTAARPAVGYEQMMAENPGLTRDMIDLYSMQMRQQYNTGLMDRGVIPNDPAMRNEIAQPISNNPYFQRVQSAGVDPYGLLGITQAAPPPPAVVSLGENRATGLPSGRGVDAAPVVPPAPQRVQAPPTLSGIMANRGTGYGIGPQNPNLDRTYPEYRNRNRQSGYIGLSGLYR